MATKKTAKPVKKAAKPSKAAQKSASKAPKKKSKGGDEEDLEFMGIEEDEFKVDDEMDMNMFSDGYDDDDDF